MNGSTPEDGFASTAGRRLKSFSFEPGGQFAIRIDAENGRLVIEKEA